MDDDSGSQVAEPLHRAVDDHRVPKHRMNRQREQRKLGETRVAAGLVEASAQPAAEKEILRDAGERTGLKPWAHGQAMRGIPCWDRERGVEVELDGTSLRGAAPNEHCECNQASCAKTAASLSHGAVTKRTVFANASSGTARSMASIPKMARPTESARWWRNTMPPCGLPFSDQ